QDGARVSTQLPVASATRAVASLISCRSSRENVTVQRIERAAALLRGLRLRERRRRAEDFAQARPGRASRLHLCRHPADLLLHFLGVLVAVAELVGDLRR